MSADYGGISFTNFSKPKSIGVATVTTSATDPTLDKINDAIVKKIASFNKNQSEVDLERDSNPLDNIIRNEVVSLFNYRKLSRADIERALALHAQGQDASHDMAMSEHILLLEQALELEFINDMEYDSLKDEPNMFWFKYPEKYLKILTFQLNLPSTLPTLEELKAAGIVDLILQTVRENPYSLIKESEIQFYTAKYINELLLRSEFIGYDKAQQIYKDPIHLMNILDKITLERFLIRVKPYLTFITEEKINTLRDWLPSQYLNIEKVFSLSQIRLMIDKELDIKNFVLKTLTAEEVTRLFESLVNTFKVDFTDKFTNEKLVELIILTLQQIYPVPTNEDIYNQIGQLYSIEVSTEKIQKIENYLTSY